MKIGEIGEMFKQMFYKPDGRVLDRTVDASEELSRIFGVELGVEVKQVKPDGKPYPHGMGFTEINTGDAGKSAAIVELVREKSAEAGITYTGGYDDAWVHADTSHFGLVSRGQFEFSSHSVHIRIPVDNLSDNIGDNGDKMMDLLHENRDALRDILTGRTAEKEAAIEEKPPTPEQRAEVLGRRGSADDARRAEGDEIETAQGLDRG